MGNRTEQRGQRQNRAEFSCEAENWSSNYFQFAPIPAGRVEDVPCWLKEFPFNRMTDCNAGSEGAQQELSRTEGCNFRVADNPPSVELSNWL
jgi:hypothetical protein